MAVTISVYNHTAKKFLNKEVDLEALTLMLLSNDATFTAAHTQLTQVSNADAYEVHGSNWTEGGELIENVTVSTVTTNDAKIDGDDISVTATGGDIGPAYKAVIYDDTDADDMPLFFIDFDGAKTAGNGTAFIVAWHADGIYTATQA